MSGHSPPISWLMCSHVTNDTLRRAIASCLEQSFKDFELLVVANGPQHTEIASAVASWFGDEPRLRVLTTEARHLTFSLNLGLHHAQGELIARMDADDIAYRERLTRQYEFMQAHPEVGVLGSAYDLIDTEERVLRHVVLPLSDRGIRRALLWRNPLWHPSVMLRRQLVLDAGGYLGGIHGQDYDLWLRLMRNRSMRFANLREALIGYRATPVGDARRARSAYAASSAAQWRNFVNGAGPVWAASALWTIVKSIVRSAPRR